MGYKKGSADFLGTAFLLFLKLDRFFNAVISEHI